MRISRGSRLRALLGATTLVVCTLAQAARAADESTIPTLPVLTIGGSPSSGPAVELTPEAYLRRVNEKSPQLIAARLDVAVAAGDTETAQGAFDPSWKTKAAWQPIGYYRNFYGESIIEQPTKLHGLTLFGGYRVGIGTRPDYDGKYSTNEYGEARIGAALPLWKNGPIDKNRTTLAKAELAGTVADQSAGARRLDLMRTAYPKYWDWVAAGRRVKIARMLLDRAQDRDQGIATRIASGDIPATERLDNLRTIVQRESYVVSAERALTQARIDLSLYYRDDSGRPVLLNDAAMPQGLPEPSPLDGARVERDANSAQAARPDVRAYEAQRKQYEVERTYATNQNKPGIDLSVVGSKDFGNGLKSQVDPVLEVGLMVDIPLRTRKADGQFRAADANVRRYDALLGFAKDKVVAEVRDVASAAEAARSRIGLARRELELAKQLETAERQRFELGDSTILIVNLREQATYEAAQREVDALVEYAKAAAIYRVVTAQI